MTSITQGSTNVYADLESPDSEQMLLKAQLAEKISQIIQNFMFRMSIDGRQTII